MIIMIVYTSASDVYCRKLHDWLPCGIWPRKTRIGMEEIWLSVFIFFSCLRFLYAKFCSHTLMPKKQMLTLWDLNRLWHWGSQCHPYKTTLTRRCTSCCRCRAWSLPCHGFIHKVQIQLSEVNCIITIFQLYWDFLCSVLFIFHNHSFVWGMVVFDPTCWYKSMLI